MGLFMSDHDTRLSKRFTTDRTNIRFLFSMNTLISTEFREMVYLKLTCFTYYLIIFLEMGLFMSDHVTRLSERFTTDRTNIRFLFSMNTLIRSDT